jgi:hypothetical protein
MHAPSIRALAAIAYERGEEFDPALMLSPALAERLDDLGAVGGTTVLSALSPVAALLPAVASSHATATSLATEASFVELSLAESEL